MRRRLRVGVETSLSGFMGASAVPGLGLLRVPSASGRSTVWRTPRHGQTEGPETARASPIIPELEWEKRKVTGVDSGCKPMGREAWESMGVKCPRGGPIGREEGPRGRGPRAMPCMGRSVGLRCKG